jgi:protein FAM50
MSTFHKIAAHPIAAATSSDASAHEIRRFGDSGVHTVEGNVAGARAARLTKARDVEKKEHEAAKRKIENEHRANKVRKVDDKFNKHNDAFEMEFKQKTVGLVTMAEWRAAEDEAKVQEEKVKEKQLGKKKKKKKKKKSSVGALSFGEEVEEEEGSGAVVQTSPRAGSKSLKNPNVETAFLPDKARETKQLEEAMALREEWIQMQGKLKEELVEITYSYWDGSGHRRELKIKKGASMGQFLEKVRQELMKEFPELRGCSSENLLYIKEDLIIPHHYTFYDLIVTKARGKSGPLFHFDVHDDIRMVNDARIEKDESHPGKIVERSWYEHNKHIFPASRWEIYDPTIKRDRYTIHGDEVNKEK